MHFLCHHEPDCEGCFTIACFLLTRSFCFKYFKYWTRSIGPNQIIRVMRWWKPPTCLNLNMYKWFLGLFVKCTFELCDLEFLQAIIWYFYIFVKCLSNSSVLGLHVQKYLISLLIRFLWGDLWTYRHTTPCLLSFVVCSHTNATLCNDFFTVQMWEIIKWNNWVSGRNLMRNR